MGPLSNFCRELGTQKVKTQFSPKDEDKDKDEERGNDDTAVSEVVNIVVTLRHADDTVTLQTNLKITSRPNHILTLSEVLFTILGVLFHYIIEYTAAIFDNLELRWSRKLKRRAKNFSNSNTANICQLLTIATLIITIIIVSRTITITITITVLPHLQGNIEIGRHKDRNAEVGNTKHRIY